MLKLFEKLINEHGSSVIFKERIEAIKEQYSFLERENIDLKVRQRELEKELDVMKEKLQQYVVQLERYNNLSSKVACDHCGSINIKRTGTRKAKGSLGRLGIKNMVFDCLDCGGESEIEQE